MLLLIIALNFFLNLSDPVNDGYGNSSLTPPTDIIYRSVNAIDIVDFEITKSSKLAFSISFSELTNPQNLKNGFSLAIIEAYFEDSSRAKRASELLPGSGMRLAEGESWHYALQLTGDYVKVFENTDTGIVDISNAHNIELIVDGNSINVRTDIALRRELRSYLMVGNYTAFNETGWQEISIHPNPWSYSSLEQIRPVVDLVAGSINLQKQAIDSGILAVVHSPKDTKNLWRWLMIWGLALAIIGFVAKFLAKNKQLEPNQSPNSLADRTRAATLVHNHSDELQAEQIESTLLANLDIDISEYEKTLDFDIVDNSEDIELKIDTPIEAKIDLSETLTDNKLSTGNEDRQLAPLPVDKLEFSIDETNETNTDSVKIMDSKKARQAQIPQNLRLKKKREEIKIHDLEENMNETSLETDTGTQDSSLKQNLDTKKPLRVIPIEEKNKLENADNDISVNEHTEPEKPAEDENPSFSLGDSFWDNFEQARDVSWKPKK